MAVSGKILVGRQMANKGNPLVIFDKRGDQPKPPMLRQLLHTLLFFVSILKCYKWLINCSQGLDNPPSSSLTHPFE